MIKRTIYISNPSYLSLKNQQMEIRKNQEIIGSVPIEDIAIVLLDHPQITLTHGLIRSLQGNNAVIISCDKKHMPNGYMLPLVGHSEQMKAQRHQLSASLAIKNSLWRQCIQFKIYNQAMVISKTGNPIEARKLHAFSKKVQSADKASVEGYAAALYWRNYYGGIIRDQDGTPPNNYLNYGYIVLRSMVARALVGAGLIPTIGIHHKNKYNPYCLADDIMEAYRPFVDLLVLDRIGEEELEWFLSQDSRNHLLGIATIDALFGKKRRPMMVGLEETAASLRKCYEGTRKTLVLPKMEK